MSERERKLREEERREEERAVEVSEREEGTYEHEDNRLRGVLLLLASLWQLIRGEDQRGRKLRWLLNLLRPYRKQLVLMFGALLVATGATLAPPALAGLATAEVASADASYGRLTLIVAETTVPAS